MGDPGAVDRRPDRVFATGSEQRRVSYSSLRRDVLALIPNPAGRVLDVGCNRGALGAVLRERGSDVWGIELDPDAASTAATVLNRVIVGDVAVATALLPAGERFDTIVCADVLEHVADPWATLRVLVGHLSPGGTVVLSLPNVRFHTTITSLVFRGRWPRRDRGVHDRTHLQWFTRLDALDLLGSAGLTALSTASNYRMFDRPGRWDRLARLMRFTPLRGFFAYQHLFTANRVDG